MFILFLYKFIQSIFYLGFVCFHWYVVVKQLFVSQSEEEKNARRSKDEENWANFELLSQR